MRRRSHQIYKTHFILAGFLCLLITLSSSSAWAGWHNASWNYRKQITIDPSMTPNTDRSWFPALIYKASDAQLAASACTNGEDILFTDSTGTNQLDHEIEDFNSGTGELTAWVEIQTLSSSIPTVIYMYYGNGGCVNQEDVPGTWDENAANYYKGVWHLKEEQAGITADNLYVDSTTYDNHGNDRVSDTGQSGQVYNGQEFDGTDDYIDVGNDNSLGVTSTLTLSAWTKLKDDAAAVYFRILSKKTVWDEAEGYELTYIPSLGEIHLSGSGADTAQGSLAADTTDWHHVVAVLNGTTATIYADGADVTTNNTASALISGSDNLYIGDGSSGSYSNFDGFIDEVRVASTDRSADWIVTEFNNQSNPGAYLTFGTESAGGDCDIDTAGTYIDAEDYSSLGNGFATLTGEGNSNGYLSATGNDPAAPPSNTPAVYNVNFTQTGVYRIWFRGDSNGSPSDDSLYYGWNGTDNGDSDFYNAGAGYYWTRMMSGYGTNPTSINVTSTGPSTINIWPRENGLKVDGLYVTTSTAVPSGLSGTDPDQYSGSIPNGAKIVDATTCTLSTTTIGNSVSPVSRDVWAGGRLFGVDTFTLQTDAGADSLTDLTVTFSGTNVNDVGGSGVKLWRDDGGINNKWDITDTPISTASFTGNTATFTGFTEPINTTSTQYIITYDIDSSAGVGNTLRGAVTAATVINTLVNNDIVDATLTVQADSVHETSMYKAVYSPGSLEELYFKGSSSPLTNTLDGMSLGSLYATGLTPGSLLITWDPDTTVTTSVDTSAVKHVQMSGRLMHPSGSQYGTVDTDIAFYEDRIVFDMTITLTSNPPGANDWMFMSYGQWVSAMSNNFKYSSNLGPFTDRVASWTSSGETEPISYQTFFELGATDGLVNATMQNISAYDPAGFKNIDNGGGSSFDVAFQRTVGVSTYHTSVQYSFDTTTTGLNANLAEERQNDFFTPAALNFTIGGWDGAIVGDGYVEERGAYTLSDGDADDHVRFQFEPTTTHHAPVFEISNWNSGAPAYIDVGSALKASGTHYNAAVTGTTLYLQYLSNISANTIIEIPSTCPGFVVTTTADTGVGSLRECINLANTNPGADTITFNIAGCPGGICTIQPSAAFPGLSDATGGTTIDGYSQPGAQANTVASPGVSDADLRIEINGDLMAGGDFLNVNQPGNIIKGLVINGDFNYAMLVWSTGNTITGNYIGTNVAGTAASAPNTPVTPIYINNSGNTIGGTLPEHRNVISGNSGNAIWVNGVNADSNIIRGNYFGTDKDGASGLANNYVGIVFTDGAQLNTVQDNLISGYTNGTAAGVFIEENTANSVDNNTVKGNRIGTNAAGTAAIANTTGVKILSGASSNTIGGTVAADRNIISGNTTGIHLTNAGTNDNKIYGNYIGIDAAGTGDLGNTVNGILIDDSASNNKIGDAIADTGNVISGNNSDGIHIDGAGTGGNTILKNYIGTDAAGNADLGNTSRGIYLTNAGTNDIGDAAGNGNLISGNNNSGIYITGTTSNITIQGNSIGTNLARSAVIKNNSYGIYIDAGSNFTIGGTAAGADNTVSNDLSSAAISIGGSTSDVTVHGNYIGTDSTETVNLGGASGIGVLVMSSADPSNIDIGGVNTDEGNVIANSSSETILMMSGATSVDVIGNSIYNNSFNGMDIYDVDAAIAMNLIRDNGDNGIELHGGAINTNIYHNTIHGNTDDGIDINDAGIAGTIIKNNNITANGGWGINNSIGATITNDYNNVPASPTTQGNTSGSCTGCSLGSYSLASDPLYNGGAYTLTECTSPAINMGSDLGGDQPDMNGATSGLWNNNAPDMGAYESSDCAPGLAIVKQVWEEGGTAPLGNPTAPVGATLVFLIYVKNTTAGTVSDLRINDALDDSAFDYVETSLIMDDGSLTDTSNDKDIFDATASGTGTPLSDAVDANVASSCDVSEAFCPGSSADKITIGAVAAQENAGLSISGHKAFAIRFNVKVK